MTVFDAAYDGSILELIAVEVSGKFKVFHCEIPKHGVPAENSKIRMAYHRESGKSCWELFILWYAFAAEVFQMFRCIEHVLSFDWQKWKTVK